MHESQGTFKGCAILLDEPGLHLHPDAQSNLLDRMEAYAKGNTLVYTTHLPFMLDLRQPARIRILTEREDGTAFVTDDITLSKPEEKLTLQAALGMTIHNPSTNTRLSSWPALKPNSMLSANN